VGLPAVPWKQGAAGFVFRWRIAEASVPGVLDGGKMVGKTTDN